MRSRLPPLPPQEQELLFTHRHVPKSTDSPWSEPCDPEGNPSLCLGPDHPHEGLAVTLDPAMVFRSLHILFGWGCLHGIWLHPQIPAGPTWAGSSHHRRWCCRVTCRQGPMGHRRVAWSLSHSQVSGWHVHPAQLCSHRMTVPYVCATPCNWGIIWSW